ncbi:hypothetical protein GCM10010193_05020 [Kitasatospora atroaurantiaca]
MEDMERLRPHDRPGGYRRLTEFGRIRQQDFEITDVNQDRRQAAQIPAVGTRVRIVNVSLGQIVTRDRGEHVAVPEERVDSHS